MPANKQWPVIRQWLIKYYNKQVNDYFKNLPKSDDKDSFLGKNSTKAVCLIESTDSQSLADIKRQNFRDVQSWLGAVDSSPIHSYISLPGESVEGEPQVQLWFREKNSEARRNGRERHPVRARVSFRIKEDTWTPVDAQAMARKIASKFAKPIFSFAKGEKICTYFDKKKGFWFQLFVLNKDEAKNVIEAVLDLQNQRPNWNLLKMTESEHILVKKTTTVMGTSVVEDPRPKTTVYFAYALAKVPPLPDDVPLVDTIGIYWNPLIIEKNSHLDEPTAPRKPRTPNLVL
jgi:hypothetical protein